MARCVICSDEDDFEAGEWYSLELRRMDERRTIEDKVKLVCAECKQDLWNHTILSYVENAEHVRELCDQLKEKAENGGSDG